MHTTRGALHSHHDNHHRLHMWLSGKESAFNAGAMGDADLIPGPGQSLSRVQFFVAPRTVAYQAPLPMGFPRQEYWSGLPFYSTGDLPKPGIEPRSPASPALAGGFFSTVLSELRALVWGYNHTGDRAHSLNSHKSAL